MSIFFRLYLSFRLISFHSTIIYLPLWGFLFLSNHVGAQLKAYNDERQKMPWDIQVGISKRMNHAPIRFSLTAQYLNRWKFDADDRNLSGDSCCFRHTLYSIRGLQ